MDDAKKLAACLVQLKLNINSVKNYDELRDVTIALISVANGKKANEVARITVREFLDRTSSAVGSCVKVRRKRGNPSFFVIPKEAEESIQLLLNVVKERDVHPQCSKNPFLFRRSGSFARVLCGLKGKLLNV